MPVPVAEWVQRAKAEVDTCSPEAAARRIAEEPDLLVLDVREPEEHARAALSRATLVPRGVLEMKIGPLAEDADRPILVHCAAGGRAALAARTLREMGYRRVQAVDGPFEELRQHCGD